MTTKLAINDDATVTSPRQRFLKSKRKHTLEQYAIVLYLIALMAILLGLQTTMGDSLLYFIFAYLLTSSFVVLVCATQSRCCSAHRTVYRPIPQCISPHRTPNDLNFSKENVTSADDVIFVIHDGQAALLPQKTLSGSQFALTLDKSTCFR